MKDTQIIMLGTDMFVTHAHTDHILGAVWVIRMVAQRMQSGKYTVID